MDCDNKKTIVMVASYGGPYSGNFIPSLIEYDKAVKSLGMNTVYVFPDFVKDYKWVSVMRSITDNLYFIPYKPYSLKNILMIREICQKYNTVMIYSRMTGWDITARFAMPKSKQIWHYEMGIDLSSKADKIKYWIKYHILGFGKVYHIAVSDKATETINSLKIKNKCIWIPNAINISRLRKKTTVGFGDPIRLLTFAYDPLTKGFDLALDACERLNQGEIKYILMASAQKKTYQYIEERYGNNKPEWLELLKPTDKISDVFDCTDILLSPSRSEGLSFANLEGIYSGLPVVFSDIPGNSVLHEFQLTYSFLKGNYVELSKAIETCRIYGIDQSKQNWNREKINASYSIDTWREEIKYIIQKVLSEA